MAAESTQSRKANVGMKTGPCTSNDPQTEFLKVKKQFILK